MWFFLLTTVHIHDSRACFEARLEADFASIRAYFLISTYWECN
jgi:hypothetical protein